MVTLALPAPRLGTADLLSSLEDLELSNRRLAGENAKLQRSVETAEEGSARLGEEIVALRKQLRRWARPPPTILAKAPASLSAPSLPRVRDPAHVRFFFSSFLFLSYLPGSCLSISSSDSLYSSLSDSP